ncbi:MAG: hypothetical protein AVDCRST_MAG95-2167 [uncultured Adhaeribacter sp.]|uniref:DUF4349 domain-containing protein n=1 Tax=uncultured Adhaeribacter sp. TaxID=448109 RepID=A0A6J4IQX7_9BACT|nr:MAG: hypothetical protein AVDCRST_MAG95-2167 [uncultured Adhaeribacter sp.]
MKPLASHLPYFLFIVFIGTGCHSNGIENAGSSTSVEKIVSAPEPPSQRESYETSSTANEREEEQSASDAVAAPNQEVPDQNTLPTDQKIIRTARVRFQVSNFKESTAVIQRLVPQFQAQLISANETRTDGSLESNLVIKVPPLQFEALLNKLVDQSIYLDTKNITSEDVTTEYIDLAARLKTKQAVEARYRDLLKQARTVKDIIAVEEQLRQIREEIESAAARLTYINRQSSYSTIHLQYYQTLAATSSPETSFAVRIRNALRGGWDLILALFIGALHLWPLILIIPVLVFYLRKFIRKYPPVR